MIRAEGFMRNYVVHGVQARAIVMFSHGKVHGRIDRGYLTHVTIQRQPHRSAVVVKTEDITEIDIEVNLSPGENLGRLDHFFVAETATLYINSHGWHECNITSGDSVVNHELVHSTYRKFPLVVKLCKKRVAIDCITTEVNRVVERTAAGQKFDELDAELKVKGIFIHPFTLNVLMTHYDLVAKKQTKATGKSKTKPSSNKNTALENVNLEVPNAA